MKKKTIINTSLVMGTLLCMSVATLTAINHRSFNKTDAVSLPTTIDLRDNTASEIKAYYSKLNNKSESELKGTNLLKNLKGIINDGNTVYFSYAQVGDIYTITDRDWTNSPKGEIANYDSSTNKITSYSHSKEASNNPYLHLLYNDYSKKTKTHYSGDGDVSDKGVSFDKEHAWSQSHGFKDKDKGENLVGAGTDLHHLIAGTQYGNRTLHNNYSYGFVKENDKEWAAAYSSKPYEQGNKRGEPLFAHTEDQENKVFEPQDSDKGDIARALLYMVACYNNYDGSTPTPENPALKLVNYVIADTTGYSSDKIENGYYGVIESILAWHHMDPVDEFEIHRNNLIYNNYQHNRNPFVDYPQWVDYIWGTSTYNPQDKTINYTTTPTGSVDLSKDVINGYRDGGDVPTPPTSESTPTSQPTSQSTSEQGGSGTIIKGVPNWVIFVAAGVVAVIVIVLIFAGVLKVTKKGKIKVNTKKVTGSSSKKSSTSKNKKKK